MEVGSRILAGVVRRFLPKYRETHHLSRQQRKAVRAIMDCRTPALGAHEYHCEECGKTHVLYHGCRNRHCPQCEGAKTGEWLEKQRGKLLPIPYYHAVFTVASELRTLIAYNQSLLYGLLFSASSTTLKEYGENPKWLGGKLGMIGVLHTWGQQLCSHPHIHYIVTGGGVDAEGRWVRPKAPGSFLFPVVEMSAAFKERLLKALRRLHRQDKLRIPPGLDFEECLAKAEGKKWEIYLQPPMRGPDKLLDYLGRYTHKVAISPSRIVEVNATHVSFSYRDYARGGMKRLLKLLGTEFLGRFLQHVLPQGFRRIRQYGILRGGQEDVVAKIREELQSDHQAMILLALMQKAWEEKPEPLSGPPCPDCGAPMRMGREIAFHDSS